MLYSLLDCVPPEQDGSLTSHLFHAPPNQSHSLLAVEVELFEALLAKVDGSYDSNNAVQTDFVVEDEVLLACRTVVLKEAVDTEVALLPQILFDAAEGG